MAFWGRSRWLSEGAKNKNSPPVSPWQEEKVEAAGYRLSVGAEYFINGHGTSTIKKLESGDAFVIGPGQFSFILTKEKVRISRSAIGFISIRASIKFRGLVNVSGFQINPGFHGNLVFAVFNAGPRPINLRYGDEIFSVWIADLDEAVPENHEEKGSIPNNLDKIPSDTINGIAGEALTAYQLSEQISELKKELETVKNLMIRVSVPVAFILAIVLFVYRADIIDLFKSDARPSVEAPSGPDRLESETE